MIKRWKTWAFPTRLGVIGSVASVFGVVLFFISPSQSGQEQTFKSGDKSPIVSNNTGNVNIDYSTTVQGDILTNKNNPSEVAKLRRLDIKYLSNWEYGSHSEVKAEVNGNQYLLIGKSEELCLEVIEQRDFDGNGSTDALIKNITACGGNCCGDSFFFISYRGNGHFQRSAEFGYSWSDPKIEEWKGLSSVVVTDHNEGVNQYRAEEEITRYVLDTGKSVKVEESKRQRLLALQELNSADFDFERTNEVRVLTYDLNGDGVKDRLEGRLWHRWGRIVFDIEMSKAGRTSDYDACKRIGILSSKTNGVNNLVCDQDHVLQWDGLRYR
ncbi:hypothetical protein [Aeromonas enteropelogenes]|uniref:hypothetical protein n=1 Tax=Aeromonas enteropelogenes TaxID=29489 RepID=UPI0012E7EF91|nr:hypothetical protein [Aeromonas enteropelogenes]